MARLSSVAAGAWSKRDGNETHSRNLPHIQIRRQFARIDPRRTQQFEWSVRAPPHGNVRAFDKPHARVERRLDQAAQIRRGIRPGETGRIEPVSTHPALHRENSELRVNVVLCIEHLRKLSQSHAMANRNWTIVREVFRPRLRERALHESTSNRVR